MALNKSNQTAKVAISSSTPRDVKALIWSDEDSSGQNLVGVRWNTSPTKDGVTVRWYADPAWTPDQVAQIKAAFDTYSNVTNITFKSVTNAASADIVIFNEDIIKPDVTGVSGTPQMAEATAQGGTPYSQVQKTLSAPGQVFTYIDMTGSNSEGGVPNGAFTQSGFETLVHELGHAVGLKHTHEGITGNPYVFPGIVPKVDPDGTNDQNQTINSVMSYVHVQFGEIGNVQYAASPMAYDIAALQLLYGAKTTANTGNNTYRLLDGDTTWTSIWDAKGTDTISYDGNSKAVIDLRPATLDGGVNGGGYLSYVYDEIVDGKQVKKGGLTIAGDITNALGNVGSTTGVVIENASGGSNDDDITGNDAGNTLRGNGGADTLKGLGGADLLYGGAGTDTLNGGDGSDQLYGEDDADSLAGGAGVDYLSGGKGADRLFGEDNDDQLVGGDDNDRLEGGAGADQLNGDAGNDILWGGVGADILKGGAGEDDLAGDGGTDTLYGGVSNDILDGGADKDALYGGDGDDRLRSSAGNDYMDGGAGIDTIDFSRETLGVSIDLVTTKATIQRSSPDTDTVVNVENVVASTGSDTIRGNSSDNVFSYVGSYTRASTKGGFDDYVGGGGNDTVDFSRFTADNLSVNLATGYASSSWHYSNPNGGEEGSFGQIAHLSGIQSVVGSFGNDTVTGDDANNSFTYLGIFTRYEDTGGIDTFDGGLGFDTLDLSRLVTGGAFVNLAEGTSSAAYSYVEENGGGGGGRLLVGLSSVEAVVATLGNDHFKGNETDNTFTYVGTYTRGVDNARFDEYDGGDGNDTVDFSRLITGDLTVDLSTGMATADYYYSDPGEEGFGVAQITGLSNIESVIASLQSDTVQGSGADNTFSYVGTFTRNSDTGGLDTYSGGEGSDTLDLSRFSTGTAYVDLAAGTVSAAYSFSTGNGGGGGGRQIATFSSIEIVVGSDGADQITGDAEANVLNGEAGRDRITGAAGDDMLSGGAGIDAFRFDANFGNDTITDLNLGRRTHDNIELSKSIYADWDSLLAANAITEDDGGNAVLHSADGLSTITFVDISASELLAAKGDFFFV